MKVVFVGATRNFFKIGYTTIHYIANHHPWVKIRLAIPDIENARPACNGVDVELVKWEPNHEEPLKDVFKDCAATLLVPPIKDRINVTKKYLESAKNADIKFIVCIGVQHENLSLRLACDMKIVESLLMDSGIPYCILNLPMFLENLLYQTESIKSKGEFYYPCRPESKFSYISCQDLAPVIAHMMLNSASYQNTKWTAEEQTNCEELSKYFSKVLDRNIKFVQIKDEEFLETLLKDGGSASSKKAAKSILELWKEIDNGRDIPSTDIFAKLIGKKPMTADVWIKEHICCFTPQQLCDHPQPPKK